jgi:hypothetical protein
MNVQFYPRRRDHGSILLTGLIICGLMGVTLGSYLLLVRAQRNSVARSQAWNAAITVAEAGVEEALSQLNPSIPMPAVVDRTANGWGAAVSGLYGPKTRAMQQGTYTVTYTAATFPHIYSTGYVTVPTLSATIARTVHVTTTNIPLFTTSIVAVNSIDMNGNKIYTDSFDSADPAHSDNGRYPTAYPSRTGTNGDVASVNGVVNLGGADLKGDLLLGPNAPWSANNNGSVSGSVSHDFNVTFPPAVLPDTTWVLTSPDNQVINGVTYQYAFLNSGDYVVSTLSGNTYVGTNAQVRLKIQSSSTPGNIRIAGTDAQSGSLKIYMLGGSFSMSGQATVDSGNAMNFSYFGLPSNTSLSFSGNTALTGTIYAPSALLTISGGGSTTYDLVGSCIVNAIRINGHMHFHFDDNLLRAGPSRGYLVTAWREE